ncbi:MULTISPECIES: thiol:disulfide interchange protein DsbA/DsbL [Vibrio]|uniref:Thiol:disulfide interchange protein n=2 Tax=Vibrio TaxID=662 RepID=A0A7X4LLK9_9VIBR|nr:MULTISPECIES: thiol:disulfide interchange protein DsbA/DsbL [Vibrio]MBF9001070.1 thiol:disulfide interchange protein DsbA/DsbL [Vibrio nitrifigilis]MZI93811.1 thioredoxin domain-containing protein [Vibrio eleionomae]
MKKLFALAATLMLSLSAHAAQFKAGVNYTELDQPHSEQPSVVEFFSFYCPHCHAFEPIMSKINSHLGKGITLEKSHVSFMGGNMGFNMSKAFFTMVALDVQDKMIPVMFAQIHDLRKPPKNVEELRQIFVDHGVDGKKFDDAFNSFAVDSMARRSDKNFQDFGLQGVPSVVVNNKYLVKMGSIKSIDEFYDLVNYLTKL